MEALFDENRRLALIEEITAAFDGVVLEDGVSLSETYVIDDYRINDRNHEMRVQARAEDTDARWQDIPDETIASSLSTIWFFFDSKGYRYYIPAFVICYLRHLSDGKNSPFFYFIDNVSRVLQFGLEDRLDDFFLDKFSLFSYNQAQAIARFLEFKVEYERKLRAKSRIENEIYMQAEIAKGEMTEEEAQDCLECSMQVQSYAEKGLNRYWGQFLQPKNN